LRLFHHRSMPSERKSLVLLLLVKNRKALPVAVSSTPPGTSFS